MSEDAEMVRGAGAARPADERRAPGLHDLATRLGSRWGLLGALVVVVAGFSLADPSKFATAKNLEDILVSQPPGVFIAFAAMATLVVGMFDLSLGATLGFAQYLAMYLMTKQGLAWEAAVVITIGFGLVVGAVNATLVVWVGINSFIATIGMSTVITGLLQWLSDGGAPIFGGAPQGFVDIAQTELLGLALPVYYALIVAVLLWIALDYTVLGRELRATGANQQAAFLSGMPTNRSIVLAFVVAGGLAAAAGILAAARIGSADASSGIDYLLPAFAAAFLGATAVQPGHFNVWGTVIAIFLVAVGITGLQLQGVASWVTPVFNGVVLLLAVAVSNFAGKGRLRTHRRQRPRGRGGGASDAPIPAERSTIAGD